MEGVLVTIMHGPDFMFGVSLQGLLFGNVCTTRAKCPAGALLVLTRWYTNDTRRSQPDCCSTYTHMTAHHFVDALGGT